MLVSCQQVAIWRCRPGRPSVSRDVIYPYVVDEASCAACQEHLAIEGARCTTVVIPVGRVSQWRPAVGSNVVGCKAIASVSLCAVNDAARCVESTRGRFTGERHRCAGFPHSSSDVHSVHVVHLRAVVHTTENIEVRGRLSEAIPHIRYRVWVTHCPRPDCAASRRTRRCGCDCGCRRRRALLAQPCYGHSVTRTTRISGHFAYHHNKRLPRIDVNLERLIRIWTAT